MVALRGQGIDKPYTHCRSRRSYSISGYCNVNIPNGMAVRESFISLLGTQIITTVPKLYGIWALSTVFSEPAALRAVRAPCV